METTKLNQFDSSTVRVFKRNIHAFVQILVYPFFLRFVSYFNMNMSKNTFGLLNVFVTLAKPTIWRFDLFNLNAGRWCYLQNETPLFSSCGLSLIILWFDLLKSYLAESFESFLGSTEYNPKSASTPNDH